MQAAALRTMAVAKVRDVAIDLVTDTSAFAASGDHCSWHVVISFHRTRMQRPNAATSRAGHLPGSNSNAAFLPGLDGTGPAFAQRTS